MRTAGARPRRTRHLHPRSHVKRALEIALRRRRAPVWTEYT